MQRHPIVGRRISGSAKVTAGGEPVREIAGAWKGWTAADKWIAMPLLDPIASGGGDVMCLRLGNGTAPVSRQRKLSLRH